MPNQACRWLSIVAITNRRTWKGKKLLLCCFIPMMCVFYTQWLTLVLPSVFSLLQLAPENTMVSFNRALQHGASSLEADVAIRLLITHLLHFNPELFIFNEFCALWRSTYRSLSKDIDCLVERIKCNETDATKYVITQPSLEIINPFHLCLLLTSDVTSSIYFLLPK